MESALLGVHLSDYIYFHGPSELQCTFDILTEIHAGSYKLSLSNNGVQFTNYENGLVDVRQAIWIRNISPKLVLSRGGTNSE